MKYRLGDICTLTKGATGIMKAIPGPYPMVTLAEERRSHTEYQFDAPAGAVIVPLVSSTGHGHASMKRVHYQEGKFALGNILCAVIPNDDILLAKYLHIYLQDNKDEVLVPLMRGMANVSLSMGKIADIELDIPSLEQQLAIIELEAEITHKADKLLTLLDEQDHFRTHLHQAILLDAVQGKLTATWRQQHGHASENATDLLTRIRAEKAELIKAKKLKKDKPLPPINTDEVPFDLPEGWTWCRFIDVNEIQSNLVDPFKYPNFPHIAPDNIEKGTGKLIGYKSVKEDEVISANHFFIPGQLIYSKVRPRLNKVVLVDFEGLCSADMYPIQALVEPKYTLYYMLSLSFLNQVDKYDNRVKMPKINQNQLSQIPFPLPPQSEQVAIVEAVERALAKVKQLHVELSIQREAAGELLKALLHGAFQVDEVVDNPIEEITES